jgi:hypothetical protein
MTFPSAPGPSEVQQYKKTGTLQTPVVQGAITQESIEFPIFLKNVAQASPEQIFSYAKALKAAGYLRGKITNKYTPALQNAFGLMEKDRLSLKPVMGDIERSSFLISQAANADAGEEPRKPYVQIQTSTKTQARGTINQIFQDVLGRGPTQAEFDKYYNMLVAKQAKSPQKTTYTPGAGGATVATTTGGLDSGEYLFQQIAKTDEAKANKVFSFYDTFKRALGVD